MSIRAKILTAFLLLSLAAIAASGISLYLLARSRENLEAEYRRIDRYSGQVQRANQVAQNIHDHIFSTLISSEEFSYSRTALDDDSIEFYNLLEVMDRLTPERQAQHAAFREAFVSYYVFANRMLEQGDISTHKVNPQTLEDFRLRQRLLSEELIKTLAGMRDESRKNLATMGEVADTMNQLSIAVAAATVLAAALSALLLSRSFARPMTRLVSWVESTEGGDELDGRTPIAFGSDEVGRLANAFSELKKRLAAKERELMRRNLESVGRLAGGVAHEYNNLLNAISACLYPLRAEKIDSGSVREEAERISLLCRRGGELSSQLLAVAGSKAGRLEQVDPSYFAGQLKTLLPRLVAEGVRIKVDSEKDLPSVRCSPALLLSAILNLVYNAVDAMDGCGELSMSISRENGRDGAGLVVFSVMDTGKGIPPEILPLIFDPFYTTKEPGRGAGLGLSIVHSFAEHHGGTVSVTSGKGGTEFRLAVPAMEADSAVCGQSGCAAVLTERIEAGEAVARALAAVGVQPLLPKADEDLLDALQRFPPTINLALIDTELSSIAPELAHKLLLRFFPGVRVAFFGPTGSVAASIDPKALWVEQPTAENLSPPHFGGAGEVTH